MPSTGNQLLEDLSQVLEIQWLLEQTGSLLSWSLRDTCWADKQQFAWLGYCYSTTGYCDRVIRDTACSSVRVQRKTCSDGSGVMDPRQMPGHTQKQKTNKNKTKHKKQNKTGFQGEVTANSKALRLKPVCASKGQWCKCWLGSSRWQCCLLVQYYQEIPPKCLFHRSDMHLMLNCLKTTHLHKIFLREGWYKKKVCDIFFSSSKSKIEILNVPRQFQVKKECI